MSDRPNPGSDTARAQGCTCAVLDNNRGRFAPRPPDGWWSTQGCPVHAPDLSAGASTREGEDAVDSGDATRPHVSDTTPADIPRLAVHGDFTHREEP